jgi:hypothetical protein
VKKLEEKYNNAIKVIMQGLSEIDEVAHLCETTRPQSGCVVWGITSPIWNHLKDVEKQYDRVVRPIIEAGSDTNAGSATPEPYSLNKSHTKFVKLSETHPSRKVLGVIRNTKKYVREYAKVQRIKKA